MVLKIIILVGLCLLVVGCNSSYQDCYLDCKSVNKMDFKFTDTCSTLMDALEGNNRTYDCQKTNYDGLREYCFEQCKP